MERGLFGLLFVFSAYLLSAQEPGKYQLSLKEAQDLAVENNWNYKNAAIEVQKAKKKVWETTAMGLPQLNGELSYQHFLDIPVQVAPAGAFAFPGMPVDPNAPAFTEMQFGLENNATAGLTASQLIFDGSYIIGLRAAKAFVKTSENQLKKSEIEVRESVAKAYYLVLAAAENKRIMEENLISAKSLLDNITAMNEEGLVELMEVDQMKLNVANIEAQIDHANASLKTSQLLLNFNLGLTPVDEVKVSDKLDQFMNLNSLENAIGKANVEGHIDYISIENKEKLDLLNWRNEQARSLPSIAAFYNYQSNAFGNEFDLSDNVDADGNVNWYPTQIVGVKVTVPLFTSFRGSARMKQARLTLEQTRHSKEMVKQSLLLNAETAKAEYINAMKQHNNSKSSEKLAKDIYERTSIKYNEGLSSSFELNQSKAQHLQAQGAYIQSIVNVLNAKLNLDKAYSNL